MAANDAPPPPGAPLWRQNETRDLFADLAAAFVTLVRRHNYRPADVWAMTPRQISATLDLCEKDRRAELAERLSLHALGAQGDGKEIEKQIKRLAPLDK